MKQLDKKIHGDFQTPEFLTNQVVNILTNNINFKPLSLVEPTCGKGAFFIESLKSFSTLESAIGVEINNYYLQELQKTIDIIDCKKICRIIHQDFFSMDWGKLVNDLPEPILIIGNPPWVTNSALGSMKAKNLPEKNNFQNRSGIEALTGKSNFDISEWMILQYLKWLNNKQGVIAVLCKTSVARKILFHIWKNEIKAEYSAIYNIDSKLNFNASVDACLLYIVIGKKCHHECEVFENIQDTNSSFCIGYQDDILLSDIKKYNQFSILNENNNLYKWRSGIKHDCSKVMELKYNDKTLTNGFKEQINIEDIYLYPLLKSSDLGNGRVKEFNKQVIVTQKVIGEDTSKIQKTAPNTWKYLLLHKNNFSSRKSSIYKNKPDYSIFGVGDYSFANWKIAISSLYKKLKFFVIESKNGKPVMVDDTVYFIPCKTKLEAYFVCDLLNSKESISYLESMIFWNNKRPITIDILKRLSIKNLAQMLDRYEEYKKFIEIKQ